MTETLSPTVAFIRAFRDHPFRLPTEAPTLIPWCGVIDDALAEKIGGLYLAAHRAYMVADCAYTAELNRRASLGYRQVCARLGWKVTDEPSWIARDAESERARDTYWHFYKEAQDETAPVKAQVDALRQHAWYIRTALRFEACLDLPGCDKFSTWWRACPLRERYLGSTS